MAVTSTYHDGTVPTCYSSNGNRPHSMAPRASVNTVYAQKGFISSPDFNLTDRYICPHTFYPILCEMIQV